mmetsp:Transcript_23849/g.31055  ORF Transcript_23849/g.31055 Transcript_23849/m.31055 type:complete len:366 (+) Transcript_23849:68-1165(+)
MFSSLLDKIGVMDIIAPMSETHPLVLAMQQKDFSACITALETGESKGLTTAKCGPIHLAADADFVQMLDYLINNQYSTVTDVDELGNTALHYASRKGHMDSLTKLVALGADILFKNKSGQTAYDMASNLSVRQYLLPLQLQTENDRGLAPVLPGVTTAQSLGIGGTTDYGPPPSMGSYGPPPTISNYPPPPPPSSGTMASSPGGAPQPVNIPQQQPVWQPPHPDGFASGGNSSISAPYQQNNQSYPTNGSGSQPPSQPPPFNQFSAFNASTNSRAVGGRYVAFGQPPQQVPPPQQQASLPPLNNSYGQPQQQVPSPHQQQHFSPPPQYSTFQNQQPGSGFDSPHSPVGGGQLEEVSLSSNSSSVM